MALYFICSYAKKHLNKKIREISLNINLIPVLKSPFIRGQYRGDNCTFWHMVMHQLDA